METEVPPELCTSDSGLGVCNILSTGQKCRLLFFRQASSDIVGKSMEIDSLHVIWRGFHGRWKSLGAPGDVVGMDRRATAMDNQDYHIGAADFVGSRVVKPCLSNSYTTSASAERS